MIMIRARIGAMGVAVMAMAAIHGARFGIRHRLSPSPGGLFCQSPRNLSKGGRC